MLVRFLQNIPFNGDFFPKGAIVDMDKVFAAKYISDGLASLVTSDPGMYDPSAVAITGGTIISITLNNSPVGATNRSTGAFTGFSVTGTDNSGTPGNTTINNNSGRAAMAAAASTVVVTSTAVVANSHVIIQPRVLDATATLFAVTTAAGSFTVTANAAATGNVPFDFLVIGN